MQYRVLITKPIPEEGLSHLKKYCQIDMPQEEKPFFTREKLLLLAPKIDALLTVGDKIDEVFLNKAKHLKVIATYGVGYDNVDVPAATQRAIPVINLPHVVTESTAELTFALMLTLSRRIIALNHFVRQENQWRWHPLLFMNHNHELMNKKLGIIGLGRIGQAVARRAIAFNMDVQYYDLLKKDTSVKYLPLKEIIISSDYITLHVPYNNETHHLLSMAEFQLMKKQAYVINASRGPVINEADLVKALQTEEIAGAALDVYEKEPYVTPELRTLPNVVLTPHMGTGTVETRINMALEASSNIIKILNGEMPEHIVNKENLHL